MHLATRALPLQADSGSSRRERPAALPITLGPEHAVPHPAWVEARDNLLVATAGYPSLTLLLGPAGTGKSLLLQDLAQHLRATGSEVLYQARGDLPVEAAERGNAARRRFVLIDEADRMDKAALDRLSRLGKCTVVLAGLAGPRRGHIEAFPRAAIVRLAPVPAEAVGSFIATRLAQGGWPDDLFTGDAVARLAALTAGVPRDLNILLSSALFLASNEAAGFVEARHVEQAASLRAGDPDGAVHGLPKSFGPAAVSAFEGEPLREVGRLQATAPVPLVPRVARKPGSTRRLYPALLAVSGIAMVAVALSLGYGEGLWHRPAVPAPTPALPVPAFPAPAFPVPAAIVAAPPVLPPAVATAPNLPAPPIPPMPPTAASDVPPASVIPAAPLAEAALPEPPLPEPPLPEPPVPEPSPLPVAPAPEPMVADIKREPAMPSMAINSPSLAAHAAAPVINLPAGAPARVALRYPSGNAEAGERAAGLAASLRNAGYLVEGLAADLPRDAQPGSHYFYAEDRATADAVAKAAGLAGTSTLAPGLAQGNSPRPGQVELLIGPN